MKFGPVKKHSHSQRRPRVASGDAAPRLPGFASLLATLALPVCLVTALVLAGGCSSSSNNSPTISTAGFSFTPVFKGGSAPDGTAPQTPEPPTALKATPSNGLVTLTWKIPQIYESTTLKIGYRIFVKQSPPTTGAVWDFSLPTSLDWELDTGTHVLASACAPDGTCSYPDPEGGPALVSYAVIAYWDITDFHSNSSVHVEVATTTLEITTSLSFAVGFMDARPFQLIGTDVPPVDSTPSISVYNLAAPAVPWYLLDATQNQATAPAWALLAAPLVPAISGNSLAMLLPDEGFHRGIELDRGQLSECDAFAPTFKPLCLSILISRPMLADYDFGQQADDKALSFTANPLPTSRKFNSRAMSIQTGASGAVYDFVADDDRILIRPDPMLPCFNDPGEAGNSSVGPDGLCGYQWSIGTFSPRLRCAFRADGTSATGETDCSAADLAYSEADATPPSNFSLRRPGAPIISGKNLYIPDAGNARILRLPNFEEAIKACGQLLPAGSTAANDFCHFDQVIGQYGASATDPARFTARSCVRGGERGGLTIDCSAASSASSQACVAAACARGGTYPAACTDPSNPASTVDCSAAPASTSAACVAAACVFGGTYPAACADPVAQFVDPTGGTGSGGAACRMDMVTDTSGAAPVVRRSRQAGDFEDQTLSMLSPDTGLLSEITKRSFRAPVQIGQDPSGSLYVMDLGVTKAQSASSPDVAELPPRIMIWHTDPFSFQKCVPTDPKAVPPSCSVDQNNTCSGTGCVDAQCEAAVCNATFFVGQESALYGFNYQNGQTLGVDFLPGGYYPLTAFDLGVNGDQVGLWAVTGQDAKVLHWRTITQGGVPDINNSLTDGKNIDPTFRSGVFAGITVDPNAGTVTGWDTKLNVGISWMGLFPSPTPTPAPTPTPTPTP